ncbi:DNA polymerase III subunit beta [Niveispirillum cyanobacteriorum]|uniref:Beta sliding clamp n=1 Tax=Niveispirillum cyanobacteriorum TaxID=1612173 RepID=A0A2K9NFU1_9PROT|nr:hypothetical protein [Niveispirillum cyanobacteriorum]AUN31983.1 hypothetical protein C0V82_16265 [Niveispirillum cyanobacteriorum]GGE85184.1 DNA polymerase III subunit beta [Niveispirillum cyanobacteriorum]
MPDALTLAPDLAKPAQVPLTATVQAGALRAALSFLRKVAERRSTLPILSHILVRGVPARGERPAHLDMIATDMDMQLRRTVRADVPAAFEGTLDPWILDRLLMSLPRLADVTLTLHGDTWLVDCPAAAMHAKNLMCLSVDDFPLLDNDLRGPVEPVEIDAAAMAGALSRCAPCAARDSHRYYLNGVYLHPADRDGTPRVTAVSTDGHRLMVTGFASDLPLPKDGIIVPRKAVTLILLMLAGQQTALCAVPPTKREGPAALVVRLADGTEIITRTIDGTFPDYLRVIPQGVTRTLTLPAGDLLRALRLAAAPIPSNTSPAVRIAGVDAGRLAISTGTRSEDGSVTAHVSMQEQGDHPPLPGIGLNADYLRDVIDIFGGDSLIWRFTEAECPQIFTVPDSTDICVQMPMRV